MLIAAALPERKKTQGLADAHGCLSSLFLQKTTVVQGSYDGRSDSCS